MGYRGPFEDTEALPKWYRGHLKGTEALPMEYRGPFEDIGALPGGTGVIPMNTEAAAERCYGISFYKG